MTEGVFYCMQIRKIRKIDIKKENPIILTEISLYGDTVFYISKYKLHLDLFETSLIPKIYSVDLREKVIETLS